MHPLTIAIGLPLAILLPVAIVFGDEFLLKLRGKNPLVCQTTGERKREGTENQNEHETTVFTDHFDVQNQNFQNQGPAAFCLM